MTCGHCRGAGQVFGDRRARRDLKRYRKKGVSKPTQLLVEGLAGQDAHGRTLLDVGGGIGAVGYELLARGVSSVSGVDASPAYVAVARGEAARRGLADRVEHRVSDFVDVADEIEAADLVSLDRVVCCYPDVDRLIDAAGSRARRRLGLVYPVDRWWTRVLMVVPNAYFRLTRNPFRAFVHDREAVQSAVREAGLELVSDHRAGIWLVQVFERRR